jgi:hypothetical protein
MSIFGSVLCWFLIVTTSMSGFGFLFKIPGLYHPDAYIVNAEPGTGNTGFEKIATYVCACVYLTPIANLEPGTLDSRRLPRACVYLTPIAGVIHAFFSDSNPAMRSASIAPMLYHTMSFFGVYFVFGQYLNPAMASIHTAAAMHGVDVILFGRLYWTAIADYSMKRD